MTLVCFATGEWRMATRVTNLDALDTRFWSKTYSREYALTKAQYEKKIKTATATATRNAMIVYISDIGPSHPSSFPRTLLCAAWESPMVGSQGNYIYLHEMLWLDKGSSRRIRLRHDKVERAGRMRLCQEWEREKRQKSNNFSESDHQFSSKSVRMGLRNGLMQIFSRYTLGKRMIMLFSFW